jgi:hypothetical protein
MLNSDPAATTPVMRFTQFMLFASTAFVLAAGIVMFGFPARTDVLFAWTINPPLTASVLGAAYLASVPLVYLAAREGAWARARVAVPGVLLFTVITTIVTLLHLDRFHLTSGFPFAILVAWIWLFVYIFDPIGLAIAFFLQLRLPQVDPPRNSPLPAWYRGALVLLGILFMLVGLAMLLATGMMIAAWPWQLSPLTCRALGAWGVAVGFIMIHSAWENDWTRLRGMTIALTLFGVLQVISLLRLSQDVDWSRPGAIIYTGVMVVLSLLGIYGWRQATQLRRLRDAAAP